jgi:hypothetical protein
MRFYKSEEWRMQLCTLAGRMQLCTLTVNTVPNLYQQAAGKEKEEPLLHKKLKQILIELLKCK